MAIMKALLRGRLFDPEVWRMAFSVSWGRADGQWQPQIWDQLLSLVHELPDSVLSETIGNLTGWVSAAAKKISIDQEPGFWTLWDRLWMLSRHVAAQEFTDRPLFAALNHPGGRLAEALVVRLFTRKLKNDDGVPEGLRERLDQLADETEMAGLMARVMLASRLNSFYMLDRQWTSLHLLPRLDWSSSEAFPLWSGYLWAPRSSPELLAAYKKQLFETVVRSNQFGEQATNLRRLFAAICIHADGRLKLPEMRRAIHTFDTNGLADLLSMASDSLRAAGTRIQRQLVSQGYPVGTTLVREYLRERRRQRQEVYVPLVHRPGEAQVDFFEVVVELGGERRKAWEFLLRLMYSGREFAWLYERCDQLAFLDGHVRAFTYLEGVSRRCVYNNLKSAVRKIVGARRELSGRFLALVRHYLFEPDFTRIGEGRDQGGVKSRGKAIQLQPLTPIPRGDRLEEISCKLLQDLEAALYARRERAGVSCGRRNARSFCSFRLPPSKSARPCRWRSVRARWCGSKAPGTRFPRAGPGSMRLPTSAWMTSASRAWTRT
jgi:hypothetical protein